MSIIDSEQFGVILKNHRRYRWLIENCVEVSRGSDGEEVSYFLFFDDTQDYESMECAIDRCMIAGNPERGRLNLEIALDAWRDPTPPNWLSGAPWRWEIYNATGTLMAGGEGCRTAAVAIETARVTAYQEGWL